MRSCSTSYSRGNQVGGSPRVAIDHLMNGLHCNGFSSQYSVSRHADRCRCNDLEFSEWAAIILTAGVFPRESQTKTVAKQARKTSRTQVATSVGMMLWIIV